MNLDCFCSSNSTAGDYVLALWRNVRLHSKINNVILDTINCHYGKNWNRPRSKITKTILYKPMCCFLRHHAFSNRQTVLNDVVPVCERGGLWWISALHFPEPPLCSGSTTEAWIQDCLGSSDQVLEVQLKECFFLQRDTFQNKSSDSDLNEVSCSILRLKGKCP